MKVEGIELKPCWFCGSTNLLWHTRNKGGFYAIQCKDCNASLTTNDKYKLIDKWNEKYDRGYRVWMPSNRE